MREFSTAFQKPGKSVFSLLPFRLEDKPLLFPYARHMPSSTETFLWYLERQTRRTKHAAGLLRATGRGAGPSLPPGAPAGRRLPRGAGGGQRRRRDGGSRSGRALPKIAAAATRSSQEKSAVAAERGNHPRLTRAARFTCACKEARALFSARADGHLAAPLPARAKGKQPGKG